MSLFNFFKKKDNNIEFKEEIKEEEKQDIEQQLPEEKEIPKNEDKQQNVKSRNIIGFPLLKENIFDKEEFKSNFKKYWNMELTEENSKDEALTFYVGDVMIGISLMPAPVPNQEAEKNAPYNYMWKEALEEVKKHKAHLLVIVFGNTSIIDKSIVFVKVLSAICKSENTLGIYLNSITYEPNFYFECAKLINENHFPIYNLVWFGLYKNNEGVNCSYTIGMHTFNKDEIEVIGNNTEFREIQDFTMNIASYIIIQNIVLKDGETIGFTKEQKCKISYKKGLILPFNTLQVYM